MSLCFFFFFFSSRRRHTRYWRDWSSDVCSSDLEIAERGLQLLLRRLELAGQLRVEVAPPVDIADEIGLGVCGALCRLLCGLGCGAQGGELGAARFERGTFFIHLGEALGIGRDAITIEPGKHRHCTRRLTEATDVGRR